MQAYVQRQASKVFAKSHQICLAPGFGGGFWSLPTLLSDFSCGSYWWLALVDRQSNAIHSWVTQVSKRAQYPSLPDVKVALALQKNDGFPRASWTNLRWDLGVGFINRMAWSHIGGILFP